MSDPCRSYQGIADDARLAIANNPNTPLQCDNNINQSTWYRFINSQGNDMILPTRCIPVLRCQTLSTGWMKGTYPTRKLLRIVTEIN